MSTSVFPIVGCGPLAGATEEAREYDGRWLLVTPDLEPLDVEDFPELEQVSLELRLGYLVVTAPEMLRLDIVPDVIEDDESVWQTMEDNDGWEVTVVDEGDIAAAWFGSYLNTPCRLVKKLDDF